MKEALGVLQIPDFAGGARDGCTYGHDRPSKKKLPALPEARDATNAEKLPNLAGASNAKAALL